ncbi:MAG: YceI family protein [Flavobacteriaceae bacterium]|nr:YceI family protein [Flavobacteriaceae bacterium]
MKKIALIFVACLVLTACKKEDKTIDESIETPITTELTELTEFVVDTEKSMIEWQGKKPAATHTGTLQFKEGSFSITSEQLFAGNFTIDMQSLTVTDLEGQDKIDLENHLKGTVEGKKDHFFDVTEYPEASFEITASHKQVDKHSVSGSLVIKGVKNNIIVPINMIDFDGEFARVETATFLIDRTKWGINFMSQSVFDDLKDNFIVDNIALKIKLVGTLK